MATTPSSPPGLGLKHHSGLGSFHSGRGSTPRSHKESTPSAAWNADGEGSQTTSPVRRYTQLKSAQSRKSLVRAKLQSTAWYHSGIATQLRVVLNGKGFALMMALALLIALFMPDMWVLCGMNSNEEIDAILTVVMVMFTVELFCLSAIDAYYFLSFFMIMDIVGTISMIFDITYMFGADNTQAKSGLDSGQEENLMLLRATRAARVGARAGRLSRVLRILRFLPFLIQGGGHTETKSRGIATVISGQLANLLATRVACLTIILVMVIPLFDVLTFPQTDYALQAWVDRLSENLADGDTALFETELFEMVDFFSNNKYGPFKACQGFRSGSTFTCQREVSSFRPTMSAPPREASSLMVFTNTFMVAFNMHQPTQVEAALAILNILFIIFIMIFSGLALSSVVTELAVRPLERMLGTVKEIATTVFKFSAEMLTGDQEGEDENYDIEGSSEMKLLEKVVAKLAIIADLQTRDKNLNMEDMRDEDIGILNMMQGKNIVEEDAKAQHRRSMAVPRKKPFQPAIRLEDFGLSQELYQSWSFNSLSLTKQQRTQLASFTISQFHEPGEGYIRTEEDNTTLNNFVLACEKEYLPNPFHNFSHAVDVVHSTTRIMRLMCAEGFLTDLEQYSLLIASVGHDVGHPGVNNGFLSEVGHELALQYNDRSPLENMHCAKLYTIVAKTENNVFASLAKEQYKEMRKLCIETILHTDMMGHNAMVKDLQMVYQVNSEVFIASDAMGNSMAELDVFHAPDTKMLVMETILHSADVSNPCRTWEVSHAWAMCVLEEFFAQGDQEKMRGIPVQFLNDRDKLNRPNSQIGFIEFMIAPFFAAQIRLWPKLEDFGDNLARNIGFWEEMWTTQTTPSEEERLKVHRRVNAVKENLELAKTRDGHRDVYQSS